MSRVRTQSLSMKFDESGCFFGVVDGDIDRIGMPREGEVLFGVDGLNDGVEGEVLVAGMGDLAGRDFSDAEGGVEFDVEPGSEFVVVSNGAPDAGDGGFELDGFLDAIGRADRGACSGGHRQPPGCIIRPKAAALARCRRPRSRDSGGGEQERLVFGNDEGVLVVGGESAVGGANGPAIAGEDVKVLSRVFRGKFIAGLKRLHHRKQLRCAGPSAALADEKQFRELLRRLHRQDWVVYAKSAFGGPRQVLRYLGRYTHRVAISNHRLTSFDGERVTFRWKDYAHGSRTRQMTLLATEFLRRFFLHVLPRGFVRIRHFGFLANRFRAARVKLCRQLLANAPLPPATAQAPHTDTAIWHCPHCGAVMSIIQRFASAESLSRCSYFDSS